MIETLNGSTTGPSFIKGKAAIVRAFYEQRDTGPLWSELYARVTADITDAAAFMDFSIMLQVMGDHQQAALCQSAALETTHTYRITNGDGSGLTILALVAAGDFMANTPIEFLLEKSNTTLLLHYFDASKPDLSGAPPHDVAFVAISQNATNEPILLHLDRLLSGWHGPVMNRSIDSITNMTRDGISALFAGEKLVFAPRTIRASRETVAKLANGDLELATLLPGQEFPIIIRPYGTHAGEGLEKISAPGMLKDFLAVQGVDEFYMAPFIDYRGSDGKFRKARIAFIDGEAYASHMAVSERWMVHYLNADMTEHKSRRDEEAHWMDAFDEEFAHRHRYSFRTLYEKLGLDYFVIDCAEMPDGRLLLFEAEIGMIVHALDPADIFAYKQKAMAKIFSGFEGALQRRAKAAEVPA